MNGPLLLYMYTAFKCMRHKNPCRYDFREQPPGLCHVNAEDGGTMFLQNVGNYLPADAA